MRTSSERQNGLVAVLDALGASNYTDQEIRRFIRSREIVLELLNEKVGDLSLDSNAVSIFTFNDTILIVLKTGDDVASLDDIRSFFLLLRKFIADSLNHRIMFRGAIAEGTFYANDETNTVMGQAVTDAAAWYDKADWIGIHATPRTSLVISRSLDMAAVNKYNLIIDYDVPLRSGGTIHVKAVNWAKAFFLPDISPCEDGESPRCKLLELLTMHQIPNGTENKFINTLSFFDHVASMEENRAPKNKLLVKTKK